MVRRPPQKGDAVKASLGKNLRRLRNRHDWTQEVAAEKSDMSIRYYQALERGEQWPSEMMFESLCDAFGVSEHQIFSDNEFEKVFDKIKGLMFELSSKQAKLDRIMRNHPAMGELLETIATLSEEELEVLAKLARTISERASPESIQKELDKLVKKKKVL